MELYYALRVDVFMVSLSLPLALALPPSTKQQYNSLKVVFGVNSFLPVFALSQPSHGSRKLFASDWNEPQTMHSTNRAQNRRTNQLFLSFSLSFSLFSFFSHLLLCFS